MKKIINNVLILLAIVCICACCDIIHGPYKVTPTPPDTTSAGDTIRRVLLEDFTGIYCGYCPDGHREAKKITDRYGDKVVLIGIHANPDIFTKPRETTDPDFRTNWGKEIDNFYSVSISGLPRGLVNRMSWKNSITVGYRDWFAAVDSFLKLPLEASILVNNTYDTASRNLKIDIEINPKIVLPPTTQLVVQLTEDSIVAIQLDYNGIADPPFENPNYIHKHVFRKGINGTFGEKLSATASPANVKVTKSYNLTVDPSWNANECEIVAYLFDQQTNEVRQVTQKKIHP